MLSINSITSNTFQIQRDVSKSKHTSSCMLSTIYFCKSISLPLSARVSVARRMSHSPHVNAKYKTPDLSEHVGQIANSKLLFTHYLVSEAYYVTCQLYYLLSVFPFLFRVSQLASEQGIFYNNLLKGQQNCLNIKKLLILINSMGIKVSHNSSLKKCDTI